MDTVSRLKQIVELLVNEMVSQATVEVVIEDGVYKVSIQAGEEAPAIIGRHGDTIRSLQKVLEVILFKRLGTRAELVVNVNDYREKQVERLHNIASEIAQKVRQQGRPMPFRGLNAYERRIVHEFITKSHTDLLTYSEGEGRHRELVIDLASSANSQSSKKQPESTFETAGE
jgi:spoIIIJ-associated protein